MNDGWKRRYSEDVLFGLGVVVILAGVGRWIVTGDPYAQLMVGSGMAILGVLPVIQRRNGGG